MSTLAASAARTAHDNNRLLGLGSIAGLGVLAIVATALDAGSGTLQQPDVSPVLRSLVVAAYLVVGTYTWWRRPGSRFGLLLAAVGLSYAAVSLTASQHALVHSVGRVLFAGFIVFLTYVFLCFPHDNLESRLERQLVVGFALTTAVLWLVALPLVTELPVAGPLTDCGDTCPNNAFRVVSTPHAVSSALGLVLNLVSVAGLLGLAALLIGRARSSARLRRRLIAPLLCCIVLLALTYAAYSVLAELGLGGTEAFRRLGAVSALAIPFAVLVGQVRGRVFTATSLGQLLARTMGDEVTPAHLEELLRDAVGDPLLTLAMRDPVNGGYLGVRGETVELPTNRHDVSVTSVSRDGRPVAVLIHDAALDEDGGSTRGLAATTLMLLENTHLVEELRSSRARVVASAQQERLRLERNLHDGAQQRLFGLQIKLEAAREQADDERLVHALEEVADDAAAAVEDLRALARGLYPTVLRERGLSDGLRSFAREVGIPVRIVDRGVERCNPAVEEAVYFCTLEAIQNTTKHGGPDAHASVTIERGGAALEFTISDEGVGFDSSRDADGIGLVSMQDRIGAVGGTLEVSSEPGRGTTVRGVVPNCWPTAGAAPG